MSSVTTAWSSIFSPPVWMGKSRGQSSVPSAAMSPFSARRAPVGPLCWTRAPRPWQCLWAFPLHHPRILGVIPTLWLFPSLPGYHPQARVLNCPWMCCLIWPGSPRSSSSAAMGCLSGSRTVSCPGVAWQSSRTRPQHPAPPDPSAADPGPYC